MAAAAAAARVSCALECATAATAAEPVQQPAVCMRSLSSPPVQSRAAAQTPANTPNSHLHVHCNAHMHQRGRPHHPWPSQQTDQAVTHIP
jgi:hypothetical protein